MANPQLENGYLSISLELWDALIAYRLPGEQRQCLDFIIRKTYGWHKKSDAISFTQIAKATGLKRQNVIRAINSLVSKKMLHSLKTETIDNINVCNIYEINKNYDEWQVVSKKIPPSLKNETRGSLKNDTGVVSKMMLTKDIPTKDTLTKDNNPLPPTGETDSPRKPEPQKTKQAQLEIILPEWISQEKWQDFLDHRKSIKKPMTPKAQILMLKKLEGYKAKGHDVNQLINESIINGWQGIFEPSKPSYKAEPEPVKPRVYM